MSSRKHTSNINGPFSAPERLQSALDDCEAAFRDRVDSVTDITAIPNAERIVVMVEFASGVKMKLVVVASNEEKFAKKNRFLVKLTLASFPRVVAASRNWAAFEWIEGPTVRQYGVYDTVVQQAARLLWTIHTLKFPFSHEDVQTILGGVHAKLKKRLPVLVWNQIISESEHDEILNLSRGMHAEFVEVALTHGDFSPDNLVLRDGELFSVDNDKVALLPIDFDVCRAVSFWDEWNSSGSALFDAYVEISQRDFSPESLFFWGVFDLVYRISYRISLSEDNQFLKQRLRQVLVAGAFR